MEPVDPAAYHEGYFLRGEGSNYVGYSDDLGWPMTIAVLNDFMVPGRLLEVGCATGWFVAWARRGGWDAEGIDVSEWAVQNQTPHAGGHVHPGTATALPYGDDEFDVVCSWEVLEHLTPTEIASALREMFRVLKPGGLMVHRICLPGLDDDDHTHVTVQPREWWERVFDRPGLASRRPAIDAALDAAFEGRDWQGRFFALTAAAANS